MNGTRITKPEIEKIINLRKTGHSLPEIIREVQRGSSTVFRYVKNIKVLPEYQKILQEKQGGSKNRSKKAWDNALLQAEKSLTYLGKTEKLLIAACLYWGEGTKRDFSIANSDSNLIKVFVSCLEDIGIDKRDLKVSVRLYEDLDQPSAIKHWAKVIGISEKKILHINILRGKKAGKLPYGMCRVRIKKGGAYLKLLQSTAKVIVDKLSPHSSTDRTAAS